MKLGKVLKVFRTSTGISALEMHRITGFSRSYISSIENDQRKGISMRVLEKYAEVCGVKPSKILCIQEDSEEFNWDERTVHVKVLKTLYPSDD